MKTLFLILFLGASALGAEFSGTSPSGKLAFRSQGGFQLLIWSTTNPLVRVPVVPKDEVFEYIATLFVFRGAKISPDDHWLVLEVKSKGDRTGTLLFLKRANGLKFNFLPGQFFVEDSPSARMDPVSQAVQMALKARGVEGDTIDVTDHAELRAIEWSADSKSIIVSVSAIGKANGKQVRITDARFRYSPVSQVMEPMKAASDGR